jgi:hypothetical protein
MALNQQRLPDPRLSPKPTLPEKFEAFHRSNPQVFQVLQRLAKQVKASGAQRCSIKLIYEMARMDSALMTDGKPYKLSNSYTAFYARLLIEQDPELARIFQVRTQHWQTRLIGEAGELLG